MINKEKSLFLIIILKGRFSNPAASKEKLCPTYFKICQTYFEISQTYFRPCETSCFIMQTKKAESDTCFPLCVDLFKLCCTYRAGVLPLFFVQLFF